MPSREDQVKATRSHISFPPGISIRPWTEADFPAIRRLSAAEGWPTPNERPDDALTSWRNAWPALVAADGDAVIGFVRALLDACHHLHPTVRLDLLATESSDAFYEANGFRRFQGFRKSYR